MKKIILSIFIILILISTKMVNAFNIDSDYLYVSGATIGIKVDTSLVVEGTYPIKVKNKVFKPWEDKIYTNDIIKSINGLEVNSLKELLNVLGKIDDYNLEVIIIRNNIEQKLNYDAVLKENKEYSLGLYVKDQIQGIGTLTYVISDEKKYGALGHSINDDLGLVSGRIYKAEVTSLTKANKYESGYKNAKFKDEELGDIDKNNLTGLHGDYTENYDDMLHMKCKKASEVKVGKAYILTCIEDDKIERFEIEIIQVKKQNKKDIKGLKIKVTDKKLIAKSGGIVRGMSGSPIIQDDLLVGAVTHVTLDNATLGYGIFIEYMIEDSLS